MNFVARILPIMMFALFGLCTASEKTGYGFTFGTETRSRSSMHFPASYWER
jgi:hypothetical protein